MLLFLKQKFIIPFVDLLKQGITPEMLALSVVLGFIIGIVPMVGVTTVICTILALWLDLNLVAIQIVNYIAAPLQLVLYIPFIKAGEKLFGFTSSSFTVYEIQRMFSDSIVSAVKILWLVNLQGIFIWLMISVPVSLMLYFLFLVIFRRVVPETAED